VLQDHDIDVDFAASKRWDVFAGDDAPKMDLIVTVCDNAAGETCPIWPGYPQVAHWGVADPAAIDDSHEKIVAAFQTTYEEMNSRIRALIASHPTAETIGDLARSIGQSEAGQS
ncbi:MAG: arsenate reductase ArsC, partial [Alphaproteobacteria bacterium]|nr:arsenate reductase ArsC [Alphaproteobacteria bacterium]